MTVSLLALEEIKAAQNTINGIKDYQNKGWAIGLNGDTFLPDGFLGFFTQRGLPFKYFVSNKGVSIGSSSAYTENITTLQNYINSIRTAEHNAVKDTINELEVYKSNFWAIGLNGDTIQPDGFNSFFAARNLPFQPFVRSKVSIGEQSAYNQNIETLKNYLKEIAQKENITYDFLVNVISGSLKGRQFNGFFSYDPSVLTGKGKETITVLEAEFNYLSKYTHKDGIPSISFTDGNFERIIWVSGKTTERFGFNDGFNRTQFGRDEEAFIREGKDYFGYLDKNTYVDGAGTIIYTRRQKTHS